MKMKLAAALAVFSFLAVGAHAEDKLNTFDFTTPITQLDGKPFFSTDELTESDKQFVNGLLARGFTIGKPIEMTIATVAQSVLAGNGEGDYLEKGKKFNLAVAISQNPKKVILNAQQIAMLETLIGKSSYTAIVVGQVLKVIDPNALSN